MENVIEFLRDEETASVTFSQRRFITRIRKLAEKYPDQARILAENEDGCICSCSREVDPDQPAEGNCSPVRD